MSAQWPPDGFVVVGAVVAIVASVGALLAREPLDRLHFVTPVTSLATPIVALGLALREGVTLAAALIGVTALVVALTGPVLSAAVGRVLARDDQLVTTEEPQ